MIFRAGTEDDTDAVIALFDANVEWLVQRGSDQQWGTQPWSADQKKIAFVKEILSSGTFTIAEVDGEVVGASVVTEKPMPYVPVINEPERYLTLLIASPRHRGMKIGHRLIAIAREQTVRDGIDLLRVDCWSGGDKKLVQYYAKEGFIPTEEIEARPGTSVQVFEWRASGQASTSDLSSASSGT